MFGNDLGIILRSLGDDFYNIFERFGAKLNRTGGSPIRFRTGGGFSMFLFFSIIFSFFVIYIF